MTRISNWALLAALVPSVRSSATRSGYALLRSARTALAWFLGLRPREPRKPLPRFALVPPVSKYTWNLCLAALVACGHEPPPSVAPAPPRATEIETGPADAGNVVVDAEAAEPSDAA